MPGFLDRMRARYGEGVVNLLQSTGMEGHAKDLGFGLYVVRNVLTPEQCADWHAALQGSIIARADQYGDRCVQLKGQARIVVPHDPVRNWWLYLQVWIRRHCQELLVQGRGH